MAEHPVPEKLMFLLVRDDGQILVLDNHMSVVLSSEPVRTDLCVNVHTFFKFSIYAGSKEIRLLLCNKCFIIIVQRMVFAGGIFKRY